MAEIGEFGAYNKMYWLAPNTFFAGLLQNLYADDTGELASFLQFSYFSFCLNPYGEKLSRLFESIAQDDLSHTKILGETIVMLGEKPIFKNNGGKMLGTRCIKTETDVLSMLSTGIAIKEKSIINLKFTVAKIDNRYLQNTLNTILNEEIYHLGGLKDNFETLKNQKSIANEEKNIYS